MISICDTGPVVAYLNRSDPHHAWAVGLMKQLPAPLLTTEPVLTEAIYFLREDGVRVDGLFELLERGLLRLECDLSVHWPRVRVLMSRFEAMDLADASMVVLSEQHVRCQVLTVDRKAFSVYRRNDRQTIDYIAPPRR